MSQGTAEQIYLLLRAALVRHLTAGHDCCPLTLDDVTVQADPQRTVGILNLLHGLSAEQQIILFAQEPAVADWARTALTGPSDRLVELDVVPGTLRPVAPGRCRCPRLDSPSAIGRVTHRACPATGHPPGKHQDLPGG